MNSMFWGCQALTNLDLSCLDVSEVTDFTNAIGICSSLQDLNLSNWKINSNATGINQLFFGTYNLQRIWLYGCDYDTVETIKRIAPSNSHLFT